MRAAIFDPYLDTVGGGERYVMTVANILNKKGWSVDVEWKNRDIAHKLEQRFGSRLSDINFVPSINKGRGYDFVFWLSDGSVPNLWAKKNVLHFQVPFHDVGGNSIPNKLKLMRLNRIVCNSRFTKKFIDLEYRVNSGVLYPPIDVESFLPLRKNNVILNVGRFSQLLQSKRQDVLVRTFKEIVDRGLKSWKLILAGGTDVGGQDFIEELRGQSHGYPIEIIENPNFQTVKKLYGTSKIFWSASGFGIDEEKEPEKVEHFGISVVEAMSAGCVPVVIGSGGHKEIVQDGEDGALWASTAALSEKTLELIKNNKKRQWFAENSQRKASNFSQNVFENEVSKIIY